MPQKNKSQQKPPPKRKKKAKRLEVEAAAVARGTEIGKQQAKKKLSFWDKIIEYVSPMIKGIPMLDLLAVMTGTVIIHGLILKTPSLKEQVISLVPIGLLGLAGVPYTLAIEGLKQIPKFESADTTGQRRESLRPELQQQISSLPQRPELQQQISSLPQDLPDDWPSWIAAFFIAFMLVRNGGQIIGLLSSNMSAIAGSMLA